MKYITLFDANTLEIRQSLQLTPPVGKTLMLDKDWKDVADTIKVQSGLSYVWGKAEKNDMIVGDKLVPRPVVEKTFEQLQAEASAAVDAGYEKAITVISGGYPVGERESWPVQTSEARELLKNIDASTPWIDAAAATRSLSRTDLAQRIVALDNGYRTIHGQLSGLRQLLQGRIQEATTLAELASLDWDTNLNMSASP